MKMIVAVALALVAVAAALPLEEAVVGLVKYSNEQKGQGYEFAFESDDGIRRSEQGEVKEVINEEKQPQLVIVVRGTYTYINKDGTEETISYVADENGYRAEGASVPKAA